MNTKNIITALLCFLLYFSISSLFFNSFSASSLLFCSSCFFFSIASNLAFSFRFLSVANAVISSFSILNLLIASGINALIRKSKSSRHSYLASKREVLFSIEAIHSLFASSFLSSLTTASIIALQRRYFLL